MAAFLASCRLYLPQLVRYDRMVIECRIDAAAAPEAKDDDEEDKEEDEDEEEAEEAKEEVEASGTTPWVQQQWHTACPCFPSATWRLNRFNQSINQSINQSFVRSLVRSQQQ